MTHWPMIARVLGAGLLLVGAVVGGYLGIQKYFDWLTAELPESRTRIPSSPNKK
jgi:hypothetical protein